MLVQAPETDFADRITLTTVVRKNCFECRQHFTHGEGFASGKVCAGTAGNRAVAVLLLRSAV